MEESMSLASCLSASAGLGGGGGMKRARLLPPGMPKGTSTAGSESGLASIQAIAEGLLELAVGVDVDGARIVGERTGSIFAEIETGDGERLNASPMAYAKISGGLFIDLGAGGDQFQMARPAHGEVIGSKIRLIAEVRIPAFACADEENAVACVFDDIAAVMKMNRELLAFLRGLRQHDVEVVVAADAALWQVHPFILKIRQRLVLVVRDGLGAESAGELKRQDALAGSFGTKVDGSGGVEGVVRQDGRVNGVVER